VSEGNKERGRKQIARDRLEESLRLAHGALDVEGSNILPVLLEQRDQEVDGQHDVCGELILGHLDMADSDTHAEHLLQLELDGRLDVVDLVVQILSVRDGGGEFTGLGKTGSQQTRNLLDENLRSQESIVFSSELLDELLVLVELLQVLDGGVLELDQLCSVDIRSICENAYAHSRAGDVGELDGSRETLVTLGIVVLESDLELDGLDEVSLLCLRALDDLSDGLSHA